MTKKKNKVGRPQIVFTKKQTAKVEKLSAYLNCEQIADYFGISHTAFQDIRARQSEVLLAYKKGKAHKIYNYAHKLENKAMGVDEAGDTTAIIFYLKTQAGWSTENKNENKRYEYSTVPNAEQVAHFQLEKIVHINNHDRNQACTLLCT